jgi:hypothetical protein
VAVGAGSGEALLYCPTDEHLIIRRAVAFAVLQRVSAGRHKVLLAAKYGRC